MVRLERDAADLANRVRQDGGYHSANLNEAIKLITRSGKPEVLDTLTYKIHDGVPLQDRLSFFRSIDGYLLPILRGHKVYTDFITDLWKFKDSILPQDDWEDVEWDGEKFWVIPNIEYCGNQISVRLYKSPSGITTHDDAAYLAQNATLDQPRPVPIDLLHAIAVKAFDNLDNPSAGVVPTEILRFLGTNYRMCYMLTTSETLQQPNNVDIDVSGTNIVRPPTSPDLIVHNVGMLEGSMFGAERKKSVDLDGISTGYVTSQSVSGQTVLFNDLLGTSDVDRICPVYAKTAPGLDVRLRWISLGRSSEPQRDAIVMGADEGDVFEIQLGGARNSGSLAFLVRRA